MKRIPIAFQAGVLCLALLVCPGPSRALEPEGGESPFSAQRRVDVFAEKVTRDQDRNITVAEGAVDIRSGRMRLRADRVELNDRTMDLVAKGHVILESGEDRLQGEYMEYNLRSEAGYVIDGQGFSSAYYFTGERIDKLSEDTYRIRHGTFTSCEGASPDWSFKSPDTLIRVDNYVYTWHPTLWAGKIPVFYVPYAMVPARKGRTTGLLAPQFRYSKLDGVSIRNSFFWAPLENADATFFLDYFSMKGLGYGLDVNYILAEETRGRFQGYYISDHRTGRDRGEIEFLHRHSLPWSISGLVNINYRSDRSFQKDFGLSLEEVSLENLNSYASLSRTWGSNTLVLSGEYRESLSSSRKTTLTRLPELNLTKVESRLAESPVFLSGNAQIVGLRHQQVDEIEKTLRLDLNPRLSLPLNVGSWLAVKPSMGLDYTHYTKDLNGNAADRFIYNPRLELTGPVVYRIYGGDLEGARFKHIITPKVVYNYRPTVSQVNLPRFDAVDSILPDNSLAYSLTSRIVGKFPVAGGAPTVREVMKLELSQKYDFEPPPDARRRHVGDLSVDFKASPYLNLSLHADALFDVYRSSFKSANYGFDWQLKKMVGLSVERRFSEPTVDYLDGSVTFSPGRWKFTFRGRYDLEQDLLVENLLEAVYTAACWDVTVTYIRRENTYEYRLLLNFKEIGSILKL